MIEAGFKQMVVNMPGEEKALVELKNTLIRVFE
jgi:hypothetical protein